MNNLNSLRDSKNASPATTTPTTTPSSIVKLGGNDASLRDRLEKWKTATSETASHGSSSSSVTPTLVLVSALVIHSVTVLVVGSWR